MADAAAAPAPETAAPSAAPDAPPAPASDGPPPASDAPPSTSKAPASAASGAPQGITVSASVAELAQKYRAEFELAFEGIRQRAVKLQETGPTLVNETQTVLEPLKAEFLTTVQATTEVTTPASVVLASLTWTAILVLATNLVSQLSSYVFAPVLSMAVGKFGALILATIAVPAYAYYDVQQAVAGNVADVSIRFRLLVAALTEGLLVGLVLQNSYLSGAPLPSLILGIAGIAYPFAVEKFGNNRQMILAGSVGVALGTTLVLGLLTGSLTLPYLLLTVLYGGVITAGLQYIFKNVTTDTAPTYLYQLGVLVGCVVANIVVHGLMGMSSEAYGQYKQQSNSV